jgi:hypothetical protein
VAGGKRKVEKEVLKVIKYFSFFNYPPTFEEIYTFLAKKTSKTALRSAIFNLERNKKIISQKMSLPSRYDRNEMGRRYTVGEYGIKISNIKYQISKRKLDSLRFRTYIKLLSLFPQIKLVGLSGTVTMMNANIDDDVDLFIITARNRLFTGRFIALGLAQLLGLRRKRDSVTQFLSSKKTVTASSRHKDKVCVNLLFDEGALAVPKFKQTEYVAHEVLQMKPLIAKDDVYERFLKVNDWVFDIFPNSKSKIKNQKSKLQLKNQKFLNFAILHFIFDILYLIFNFIQDMIEFSLKKLQLILIQRHKTNELISSTQLWFHPKDFGEKLRT